MRTFVLFLPLLFFLVLETALRLFDYGGNLDLVVAMDVNGKKLYVLNQQVGKRYFSEERYSLPKVYDDRFEAAKSPNTVRIFCLGASTTAGFPYEYQATPSRMLKDRLELSLPGKNVEVVNAGLTAISSFSVLEFERELLKYQPDLIVLYMGQNEFYGAFGVGSTISLGKKRWFVRSYLELQYLKTFWLVRDAVTWLRSLFADEGRGVKRGTLMEQMVQKSVIPLESEDFKTARETFEANYREIVETARDHGAALILSTLVTNEKDLEPFVSTFRDGLSESESASWEALYREGLEKTKASEYTKAIDLLRRAVELDSTPAKAHFWLGKCYEATENVEQAGIEFAKARDLDGLRFRAPSEFNSIIRNLAKEYTLPLADVERSFRQHSPDGIIGRELLWEHVHPNLEGYFLMAKAWAAQIRSDSLLVSAKEWSLTPDPPDSTCWNSAKITDVDRAIGAVRIAELKRRWPFQSKEKEFDYDAKTVAERAALEYIMNRKAWSDAHFQAAEEFISRREWNEAMAEYAAVHKTAPEAQYPVLRMGDMMVQMSRFEEAEDLFVRALRLKEDQFVHVRLGMFYLERGKPGVSVQHLQKCIELDAVLPSKLPVAGRRQAEFYLALAYARSGRVDEAKNTLNTLIREDPDNKDALLLLTQIESRTN